MTIRKKAFTAVRWTALSSFVKTIIQMSQIVILARLLAPADFGLIAIIVAIIAFLQIFADAGVSNAIIHYQDISQKQLSSLYWLNVGLSALLALVLVILSPWITDWYHQPELKTLLFVAAASMFINSIGQQLRVNAQKDLRFAQLVKVDLLAVISGFICTILAAIYGFGVYSLVLGTLVTAIVGCIFAWILLSQGWRPQYYIRISEIRRFLKFGIYMMGNNLVSAFNAQIDVLLGGRLIGVDAIGLYNVPKSLMLNVQMAINPIITQVGLPVMAKVQQDKIRLKKIYLQTMRLTSSINFPIYIGIAFFSPEIVKFVLSEKWHDATPLLQIFAIWGLLRSTGNPVGSLLLGIGRSDLMFKWNLSLLLFTAPAIWIGSFWGLNGMAISMAMLMFVLYVPNWYFLIRPTCGATLIEYSMELFIPLVLALISVICSYIIIRGLDNDLLRLILGLILGAIFYVMLSWKYNQILVSYLMELLMAFNKKIAKDL